MTISISVLSLIGLKESNERLMLRYAKNQKSQVLARLYQNCGNDLYHFLLTLSDKSLAEDVAQMTWLKVMESSHLYQPSGQFKSWLFTIGRRLLIDELRRTKKLCSFDKGNVSHIESKDTTATMDRDENAALSLFNQLLEALPFEQKEAFCLQQEGFSLRDIAKITCCEQEAIKSRLRYAKRKLIDGLNKSDLSDSQS